MIFQVAPILAEEQIGMTGNYLSKFQQTPKTWAYPLINGMILQ